MYKSRTLASEAIKGGKVKVNGENFKPSHFVKVGETYTLNISHNKKIIEVTAQRTTARHTVIDAAPKTANVDCRVDIDHRTTGVLHRHRRAQISQRLAAGPRWHETGLVFTGPDGQGLHPDVVSKYFQTLITRIPGLRLAVPPAEVSATDSVLTEVHDLPVTW